VRNLTKMTVVFADDIRFRYFVIKNLKPWKF